MTNKHTDQHDKFNLKKLTQNITFVTHFLTKISKLSLGFGSLVLFSYFILIGYTPLGHAESLFSIILTLAFVSIFIIFFFTFTFIFAPLTWAELLKNVGTCAVIVGKEQAEHVVNSFKSQSIDVSYHARIRIFLWYEASLLIYFSVIGLLYWWLGNKIAIFIQPFSFVCFMLLGSKAKFLDKTWPIIKILLATSAVAFFLLIIFWLMSMLYIHNGQTEHSTLNLFTYGLLILTASAVCLIPPNSKWKSYLWMPTVGTTFIFMIIFFTGSYTFTINRLIRSTKMGAMYDVTVDVDHKGCIFLAKKGVNTTCTDKDLNKVAHINVYWRAGEYYLGYKTPKGEIRFTMPAHYDLSITTTN